MVRLGWLTIAFGSVLLLAGCGDSKHVTFASCRLAALKDFGHMADAERGYNQQGDYTLLCMEAKGFEMNWNRCPSSASAGLTAADRATEESCYDWKPFG